jgi:hypothetical protein
MVFNSHRKLSSQSSQGNNYLDASVSTPPHNYHASVPICIYRELVKDLEATKTELAILQRQNQALKQKMSTIVNSVRNLDLEEILPQNNHNKVKNTEMSLKTSLASDSFFSHLTPEHHPPQGYIFEEKSPLHNSLESSSRLKVNLFGLIICVIVIILSCSMASFLIAKFIMSNND